MRVWRAADVSAGSRRARCSRRLPLLVQLLLTGLVFCALADAAARSLREIDPSASLPVIHFALLNDVHYADISPKANGKQDYRYAPSLTTSCV